MEKTSLNSKDIVVLNNQDLTIPISNVKRELRKYWGREYINECINNISNNKHKMLLRFMWMTGLRVSEVINIRKKDIDLQSYLITARWLKSRKYKYRVLPLHPDLKMVLELYVAGLKSEDLIFPYSRQRVYQLTKKYLKGNPHMLRHSFAVNWLKCGGDIVILHRVLGHSKIQTTMEYLKIVPIDQGRELIKIKF